MKFFYRYRLDDPYCIHLSREEAEDLVISDDPVVIGKMRRLLMSRFEKEDRGVSPLPNRSNP